MKKIVFISSGQPSANPRLVKDAISVMKCGYKVTVIYCPLSIWSDEFDQKLFQKYPSIEWVKVGAHSVADKFLFLLARIRMKFYHLFFIIIGNRNDSAIKSTVLFSQELYAVAKKYKADIYIGHNLGSLPAIINASHLHQAKAIFDFEDFHRGEDLKDSLHWKKTTIIEDKYIQNLNCATAASPLITRAYSKLYPFLYIKTINNCFSVEYAQYSVKKKEKNNLTLFWFSQFIGKKRGLELVIEAIGLTGNSNIILTLLGNCSLEMYDYFTSIAKVNGLVEEQLRFIPVVCEQQISKIASGYDLGLACEVPHILNRELCLTNKIFMYLLAGNAILYSNTKAQSLFYEQYSDTGTLYQYDDAKQLANILERYFNNPSFLLRQRAHSLNLGKQKFNWEIEKIQLTDLISSLLDVKKNY